MSHKRDALTAPTRMAAEISWTDPHRHQRSPDLFSAKIPEWLSRGHPVLPYVVVGPLAIDSTWHGLAATDGWGVVVAVFGVGWLGWTLIEYLMHRYAFHLPRRTMRQRVAAYLVHGHHHIYPDDPSRVAATPIQFLSIVALLAGICLGWGAHGQLALAARSQVICSTSGPIIARTSLSHGPGWGGRSAATTSCTIISTHRRAGALALRYGTGSFEPTGWSADRAQPDPRVATWSTPGSILGAAAPEFMNEFVVDAMAHRLR